MGDTEVSRDRGYRVGERAGTDIKIFISLVSDQIYPWGNDFKKNRMNIWEGNFPTENKGKDGFIGVSPVRSFKAQNDFGKLRYPLRDLHSPSMEFSVFPYFSVHCAV